MDNAYKKYKNLNLRIGFALLLFSGLFYFSQTVYSVITELSYVLYGFIKPSVLNVLIDLLWGGLYLASFMLPVPFFYHISSKNQTCSMHLEFRLSKYLPLFIIAGLGINFIFAYINYFVVYPVFGDSMSMMVTYTGEYYPYKFFLGMITTALVPAFCEEFLFRGMILSNLLPYGKKTAIIISAVMFGFMHQNPAQIIYTIVAGIILGIIFVESGSIWGGVIFHFINNLLSVVSEMISNVYPENIGAFYDGILTVGIMLLGMIVLLFLIIMFGKRLKNKPIYTEREVNGGIFGKEYVLYGDTEEARLGAGKKIAGFFSPTNIIFIAISIVTMLMLCLIVQFL